MSASERGFDHPTPQEAAAKICACCGKPFSCGAPCGPCWCDAVKLGVEVLANLRVRYRDCLCPACLPVAARAKLAS